MEACVGAVQHHPPRWREWVKGGDDGWRQHIENVWGEGGRMREYLRSSGLCWGGGGTSVKACKHEGGRREGGELNSLGSCCQEEGGVDGRPCAEPGEDPAHAPESGGEAGLGAKCRLMARGSASGAGAADAGYSAQPQPCVISAQLGGSGVPNGGRPKRAP
eukprot:365251-Chlamydomonas_euryale.AAC.9